MLLYIDSSGDNVRVVKGEKIILAWFGSKRPPPDHPLSEDGDIFLCCGQYTTKPWLNHMIAKFGCGRILELFSRHGMSLCVCMCAHWYHYYTGECAKLAVESELDCTCVQLTEEGLFTIVMVKIVTFL